MIAAYAARRLKRGVVVVHAVGVESRSQPHHLEAQRDGLAGLLGVAPEMVIEAKRPAEAILAVARERQTSLIIMGSRRIGGVRALSSVSERCCAPGPLFGPGHPARGARIVTHNPW